MFIFGRRRCCFAMCEGFIFLAGLIFFVSGKVNMSGRLITGAKARWMGALLMLPVFIFVPLGINMGMASDARGETMDALIDSISGMIILELLVVIAVLVVFFIILYNTPQLNGEEKKAALMKTILTVAEAAQYLSVSP